MLRQIRIKNFDKGLHTKLEPQSIPEEAASSSLNWLTLGDHIELSGGYTIVGDEDLSSGKVTGLAVPTKIDGTPLPVKSYGKKIEYYDINTETWSESGSDILGTDADGEDVSMTPYTSLAGSQLWISSPNSGLYKMILCNPDDIKDNYSNRGYKGYIKAINSSLYLWHRKNGENYLYRSRLDTQDDVTYTTVGDRSNKGTVTISIASPAVVSKTAHGIPIGSTVYFTTTGSLPTGLSTNVAYYIPTAGYGADQFYLATTPEGTPINTSGSQSGDHTLFTAYEFVGALGSTTYSGTLARITGVRTALAIEFSDGTQSLIDDKNGGFTGDGTGTINYVTGAYSITFSSTTTAPVSVTYQYEDSRLHGIADFTFNSTERAATEGFHLPQNTGGKLLGVLPYQNSLYCPHESNAWVVSISSDDISASNAEWRENIGMKYWRSAVSTGDGIYYIDTRDKLEPKFRILTLQASSSASGANVVPREKSANISLKGYDFDSGVAFSWQDYVLFTCKEIGETDNNRVFAYNTVWNCYDILEYNVSCFAELSGDLIAGDALSNNVMKLFSTTSADGNVVRNYWIGKLSTLGTEELKKTRLLTIKGRIDTDQELKVSIAFDGGEFVEVGRIQGNGSYVSTGSSGTVGGSMVGSERIGGGTSSSTGNDFVREFHSELRNVMSKFYEVKIKIEALSVGYASISEINHYDVRQYGQKNLLRYRNV